MKNPLIKRLPREFKADIGKYTVIFLFMIMLISLVSGFLVADNSMLAAYYEGFEKYNVEHGHLTFDKQPTDELIRKIEEQGGIRLYDLRYFEEDIDGTEKTTRVYIDRESVNTECLMKGEMPAADDEIAIDRMFADNNSLVPGDTLCIKGKTLKITGLVAFPDYSSLYKSNSDIMFDALGFNVGVMTKSGFEAINSTRIHYNYAWKYNAAYDRDDKVKAKEMSDGLVEVLKNVISDYDGEIISAQITALTEKLEAAGKEYAELYMASGAAPAKEQLSYELDDFLFGIVENSVSAQLKGEEYAMPDDAEFEKEIDKTDIISIDDYLPLYMNQAVNFVGQDMGDDKAAFIMFSYIVTAILAFIFAVTVSATITAEAGVIGTLRASGYSRGALIIHYITLPLIITFIAAVIGNVLGYTVFKDVMADLFYNSYSLPTYTVLWNADAFMTTTAVPFLLMLVINLLVISSKMRLTPLQFLRRELKKKSRKKAFRLNTKIPFITRFKLRIIFQNMSSYIVMVFGIILGAVIIIFGEIFSTIFADYSVLMKESVICDYQYVLTDAAPTENASAEKYAMTSFEFQFEDYLKDEITVYGVESDSRYVKADIKDGKVAVSETIASKYGIKEGDRLTLSDPYSKNKSYTFTVDGIYDYQASLSLFISREMFNDTFGNDADYYTGYFSNEELTDIDSEKVAMIITLGDFTKLSDQMEHSVGDFMRFFAYFGVIMFVLIMYILSKQVIERNFQSISMCKILGFCNREIASLYIVSSSVSVIIGLLISIPLSDGILKLVFRTYLYKVITGYFPYIVRPESYIVMLLLGIASYAAVSALQLFKISRVPKGEALKNTE